MRKTKALHHIMIEGCKINIKNIKEKVKQYQKDNKDKIKEQRKQHYEDNRDPNMPRIDSEEYKIKLSCSKRGIPIEDFPGFSKEQKYCYKFNNECREKNREKFDNKCFICDITKEENNNRNLSVHHVDMNKDQGCDDIKWQLIPLCQSCHARCHNDIWEARLKYLLNYGV